MEYPDGSTVKLGDRVRLRNGETGRVVISVDSGEYSADFPKEDWTSLESGILIQTDRGALVHLEVPLPDGFLKHEGP
jgi:hypothetical protein